MSTLRLLDLFSGIGGFSLGLERSGAFRTVAFCEIEPFCRRVLAKHWPEVPCYDDVRTLTADRLAADGIAVDAICGGFPCQDISLAGKGAGLSGERSGLWREYARLIGEIRPRYVIVENVAALLGRGLGDVLGDLAALGFDAEWHCIPASAIGAPHRRDRVWIVAYTNSAERGQIDSPCGRVARQYTLPSGQETSDRLVPGGPDVADAACNGRGERGGFSHGLHGATCGDRTGEPAGSCAGSRASSVRHPNSPRLAQREGFTSDPRPKLAAVERADWWLAEPDVGRVANGVPARVDRLRCLGNAVVPQIPELIGRAILAAHSAA